MPTATLYLDNRKTRNKVPEPPAPLKLRIYVDRDNIRHFKTNLTLTTEEFENSYYAKNPRGENKTLKTKIEAIKVKADTIIEKLGDNFTFQRFEKDLYKSKADKNDIVPYYNDYIERLDASGNAGSADLYKLSLKSILAFAGGNVPATSLKFQAITVRFLQDYERWFTKEEVGKKTKSITTVGIYLRNLRSIFNQAIKAGDISADLYPFCRDNGDKLTKYSIPGGNNIKKALDNETLKALYNAELPAGNMKMARDFWFFSYQSNGMNFKDIASLKFKDISETSFSFTRLKTKNRVKGKNIVPIMVPITDTTRAFIKEYSNADKDPENYVFPIFRKGMSEKQKLYVNREFIKLVNDNMARLAKQLGINVKVRTMEARHSFTTKVTKQLGLEFAQEALGHTSLTTTQNYFAGFETKVKTDMANKMLDFDE